MFLPGKSHGQRNLVGYSPWGLKESDTAEWLNHHYVNRWRRLPSTDGLLKKKNSHHTILSIFKGRIWWSQRACVTVIPQDCHPQISIFMANQAQSTTVFHLHGSRGKGCSLDSKPSSVSERLGFLLYYLVTFLDRTFVTCFVVRVSPQESVHWASIYKVLDMCRAPCSIIWQWGKKNNRQGRVLTTKTFTLIHCFFLSASIATWFQTHEHQNEILNLKMSFISVDYFKLPCLPFLNK